MCSQIRALAAAVGVFAVVLLTAACQAVGSAVAVGTSTATGEQIIAMGDSYTAGAMLPVDAKATPPGCVRSTKAYPVLVANQLGAQLTDVACSGAQTTAMTGPQQTNAGTNPAQLDALNSSFKVVMLSLSGDDLGFTSTLKECITLSATDPIGSPCQDHFTTGGTDQLAAKVTAEGPKLAAILTDIKQRAPQAQLVVVGYPDLFPQSGGCFPSVPITSGDMAYLDGIEQKMNAMVSSDASAAGATYVDTYTSTTGHDVCQSESNRDIEGLVPGTLALPFHPNSKGQQAMANAVLAALKS